MNFSFFKRNYVVYLMIFSFIIMVTVQFALLRNAYKGKEKDFNDKLFFVVRSFEQVLGKDTLTIQMHPTDSSVISFARNQLEKKIDSVLTKNDIPSDFVYATGKYKTGVRRMVPDTNIFWSSAPQYNDGLKITKLKIDLGPSNGFTYYVKVFLPSKPVYLVKSLLPLIIILVFTLIVLFACFLSLASIIKKQSRLADIKNDFINNMTHELKTPLFTISIASKMLAEQDAIKENNKYSSYVESIQQETGRLTKLVDKVLQSSSLNKKQLQLDKKNVDVHDAIQSTVQSFELIRAEQKASITLLLHAKKHIVYADETHFISMLYSLLDNAFKYTEATADITITTKNEGKNIVIGIADKGMGMDADTKKLIFERFFRAHTGDLHTIKGYGIGLSYVKSIMEAHHGTVHAESKPGKGSEFILTLPYLPDGK